MRRPRVAEGGSRGSGSGGGGGRDRGGGQDGGARGTAPSARTGVARGWLKGEVSQCPRTRPAEAPRGPGLAAAAAAAAAMAGGPGPGDPAAPGAQHFLYEVPSWVMCRFYKVMDALEPSDWCQFGTWQRAGRGGEGRGGGAGSVPAPAPRRPGLMPPVPQPP